MMDAVDQFELAHGIYPVAFDRRWHCGVHLAPEMHSPVYAIADGEVVAHRVCQHAIDSGNSHAGFVLLKHTTDTGEGRTLTFYSLYMHLLPLAEYQSFGHDAMQMPAFLRMPSGPDVQGAVTPAVSGGGKKVKRKDIVGFLGAYQGLKYLHFEIFMTPGDFDAYFGHTQLGNTAPPTATTSDCWGHTYYLIPAGQQLHGLPPGTDEHHKLHGIQFEPGQAHTNSVSLAVESYFNKGTKYTNVWSVADDGTRTLLTPQPVPEADYEYDLYRRAMALYSACPSDGYELLRFGRVLSTTTTQPTWVQVPYAAGKQGYIDVSRAAIKKLSDADFPFFMGWQKISDGSTPFGSDGLCDADALKKLLMDAVGHESLQEQSQVTEAARADVLSAYVRNDAHVRPQLRGFICNAPSEWDSTHNEERFVKLLDDGGFYHGNDQGYNDFLKYLKEIQFWDKTGLPAGQKVWFFHPLAFIRHFRKCGWLSQSEFKQIYSDNRYSRHQQPPPHQLRETYLKPLNVATRKYGLTSPTRLAHFLGQGAVESAWLSSMQETSMGGHLESDGFHGVVTNPASTVLESSLGHWYGQMPSEDDAWFRSVKFNSHGVRITGSYDWKNGNCDREDAQKFRGRGFKQLTGRSNYTDYWVFKSWISRASFTASWWLDAAFAARHRSGMTRIPAVIDSPEKVSLPENCLDSGGFYLRFSRPNVARRIDQDFAQMAISDADRANERRISRDVTYAINGGYMDEARRLQYVRLAKNIIS
ncbi:hypothetical protein CIC12_16915 [Burkholderia sp. SG-MS1]|nr:hypothetical protein [Paraburkholderia sp. SG-MS1]